MISITCQERVIHKLFQKAFVMLCGIWYHLYNLKNVKNTHGAVLLLVKLQTEAWNFTKSNTAPWVFFTFFKLYKWHQTAQSIGIISIKIFPERVSSSGQLNIWSEQRKHYIIRLDAFKVNNKVTRNSWHLCGVLFIFVNFRSIL